MNHSTTGLASTSGSLVGKGIKIRGEITGSERVEFNGELEGTVALDGSVLVIGANARVNASVAARQVIVQGTVNGNISAGDIVEIRSSAAVQGEIVTGRLAIEEGAAIRGRVTIKREERLSAGTKMPEPAPTEAQTAAAAGSAAM